MNETRYLISDASKKLHVETHVLRYWEEELGMDIPRNELGHRYYREEEIQLLHCIKELKNKGFQLKAVKEVLPDLEQKKLIDIHKLLTTQEELENQELEQLEQARQKEITQREEVQRQNIQKENRRKETEEKNKNIAGRNREETEADSGKNCKVIAIHNKTEDAAVIEREAKMQQFEDIMGRIVGKALREQAENLGDAMGNHLCNKMLREVDELMVEQEQREEERYKRLDETIRSVQKARQEVAVSKDGAFKKKSLFFRKNKRKL